MEKFICVEKPDREAMEDFPYSCGSPDSRTHAEGSVLGKTTKKKIISVLLCDPALWGSSQRAEAAWGSWGVAGTLGMAWAASGPEFGGWPAGGERGGRQQGGRGEPELQEGRKPGPVGGHADKRRRINPWTEDPLRAIRHENIASD